MLLKVWRLGVIKKELKKSGYIPQKFLIARDTPGEE